MIHRSGSGHPLVLRRATSCPCRSTLYVFVCLEFGELGADLEHSLQHGGGYQNGQAPNNDFSDWVGQDKKFIAVNTNYRLGLLGFFKAQGVLNEGGMANVGLLDACLGIEWVVKNISALGGDPKNIAISGQSGGEMAMNQLALFDGKNPPFQKAVPRSIQRPAAYNVAELVVRLPPAPNLRSDMSSATAELALLPPTASERRVCHYYWL